MRKKGITVYDRIHAHLFDPRNNTSLSEADLKVKERCLTIYNKKLSDPLIQDKELVKFLTDQFEIKQTQAYIDISNVERLIGSYRQNHKEYLRNLVTDIQKKVIQKAMEIIDADDKVTGDKIKAFYTVSKAVREIIKANNLDKIDPEFPWDEMELPNIDASNDVTVADLKDIPDAKIEKIRELYMQKMKEIEDAEIIDEE